MIVMIYDSPEVTSIPLGVRSGWIQSVYPSVEIIEAWNGPSMVGDTPDIMQMHEEYILKQLGDRKVTHFYSSEFYGDHVSRALRAVDRRIDPNRNEFPVSGTMIRSDPFGHRRFLEPSVYRDLVTWVVVLGAPSTGKTTLCKELASHYKTVWMPEYGREYWEIHQVKRRLTEEQLLEIALGHRSREDQLVIHARKFMFVDTDATTTRMFSQYYHGSVHPQLNALANDTARRYDLFLLCEDDIPYEDTRDRSGEIQRKEFQHAIVEDLTSRDIPFIKLNGSINDRMKRVREILNNFDKWKAKTDFRL